MVLNVGWYLAGNSSPDIITPYMIHSDLRQKILTTTDRKTLLVHTIYDFF